MSPALDVELCVTSGQVFRWQKLAGGRWLGVDGPNWFVVGSEVSSNAPGIEFERLFRLDEDLAEVQRRIIESGPELERLISGLPGLRLMRPIDAEETFFTFLCTPNNNVARIVGMVRTLARFGKQFDEIEGQSIHRFPSAEVIADIPEAELRERKFGYRAATITRAARQISNRGQGWLASLRAKSYEEAFLELMEIDGVGPKLADCIALFALHHTEAVPIDTHLWQQVVRYYRPDWSDKALTASRYREAGQLFRDRFGSLAGWAQQYFFYDNLVNWRARP